MTEIWSQLESFADKEKFVTRGPLALALTLTRIIGRKTMPIKAEDLLTEKGGQVAGLGGSVVTAILAEHGINRRLAAEGGRTSRGSMQKMQAYVEFLNNNFENTSLDFGELENFWIERIRIFFAKLPLELNLDNALSTRAVIRQLANSVAERQKEMSGVTLMGTVLQHLVGAKIEIALNDAIELNHHGSNVNDAQGRGGDFDIGDCAIHVTTAPTEALIAKCMNNLRDGVAPIIVTSRKRVETAEGLADNAGGSDRIDVMDYEQFLMANVFEIGRFTSSGRVEAFKKIVARYNEIIESRESDPSLKIKIS